MGSLRFVLSNLDQFRVRFWLYLGVAFLDGAVLFLFPVLLAEFTKSGFSTEVFWQLIPYLCGCLIVSLGCQWVIRAKGEALARHYANYLKLKYFRIVEHLPVATLSRHHSGYLLSLVARVCDGSGALVFTMIWLLAHGLATTVLFFAFTARESVGVAVLNMCILIVFLFVSVLLSRKFVPLANALNVAAAKLSERFVDLMGNIFTVKKLGLHRFAEAALSLATSESDQRIARLQTFHGTRWLILHAIFWSAMFGTISFMLFRISQGYTAPAVLILFIAAFATLKNEVERLSELIKDLLEMNAYVATLEDIVARTEEGGSLPPPNWQKLELNQVVFTYEDSGIRITIPHFEVRRGERVAVVGESGQGKSTLLNVIAWFVDPVSGERLIDGRTFAEFDRDLLRAQMAFVSQEVELFNLSLRDNLRLGRAVSDERIKEILSGLALGEWLASLPEGLDTLVGEKGIKLSAGQKQRVNIARGLLLEREVLLFDEPTAHLDEQTEQRVVEFLKSKLENRTAIIVTHRPAIGALCTRSYRFKNSQLVQ